VQSQLARVSVVNDSGNVLLDSMVAPTAPVTDYRTRWSGVREADLVGAPPFDAVRESVRQLLHGRVLVGHALENDLAVLHFGEPGTRANPTRPPERETGRDMAVRWAPAHTPYHARLPPGENTGLAGVCPHDQPGCLTRGPPSAEHRKVAASSTDSRR